MNLKAIFLDLDGTLLRSDKTISQKDLCAIKALQKSGVHVVLASGRADGGMKYAINALEMDKNGGYIVSYNGSKVLNLYTGEVLFSQTLELELIQEVFNLTKACKLEPLIYGDNIILSYDPKGYYAKNEGVILSLPVSELSENLNDIGFPIHKCLAVGTPENVSAAMERFKLSFGGRTHICKSCPEFLEVMPQGINKGVGVAHVLKALNITAKEACACGDELNDIEMLSLVGTSIAMGNATNEVKQLATYTVPSNNENGVAHAIAKLFPQVYKLD